jgi:hypothetical protein
LVFLEQPGADSHRESSHTTHYSICTRFTSAKHSSLTSIYLVCFQPLHFRLLGHLGLSVIRTFSIYCPSILTIPLSYEIPAWFSILRPGHSYEAHLRVGRGNKLTLHNLSWVDEEDSLWATIQSPVLFCPKHTLSRSSNTTHFAPRITSLARPHQENNIASHRHKSVLQVELRC